MRPKALVATICWWFGRDQVSQLGRQRLHIDLVGVCGSLLANLADLCYILLGKVLVVRRGSRKGSRQHARLCLVCHGVAVTDGKVVVKVELQRAQIWGGSHSTSHIIGSLPDASLFDWLTCSL